MVLSSFRAAGNIVIQSGPEAHEPSNLYVLQHSGTSSLTASGYSINMRLDQQDVMGLQRRPAIATRNTNTYVTVTADTIKDVEGINVVAIVNGEARQVDEFTPDTTGPVLERVDVNMTSRIFTLWFSDVMQRSSVDPTAVTIVDVDGNASNAYTLRSSTVLTVANAEHMEVLLSNEDSFALQRAEILVVSIATAVLSITERLGNDTSNNAVVAVETIAAASYTPDTISPELEAAFVDVNAGTIELEFSEVVHVSTLNVSGIVVQDVTGTARHRLQTSKHTGGNGRNVTLTLSQDDLNALKLVDNGVGVATANTYIAIDYGTIADMQNNSVLTRVVQAWDVVSDTTPPFMVAFTFNLSTRTLNAYFDEPIRASSMTLDGVVLSNAVDSPTQSRVLANASISTANGLSLSVIVSPRDISAIKLLAQLAVSKQTTVLMLPPDVLADMASVPNTEQILLAEEFGADTVSPILQAFNLYMDSGHIELFFDEPINITSVDFAQVLKFMV